MSAVIIFITTSSEDEAQKLSDILIEKRLVACVNIIPKVNSIFHWQGSVSHETEALMIAKSIKKQMQKIIATVKQNHSYEVPEIIALPIIEGSEDYLNWINDSVE